MGSIINEQGNQYERLYVICEADRNNHKSVLWLCMCNCGKFKIIDGDSLRRGLSKSCGCLQKKILSDWHKGRFGDNQPGYKHGACYTRIYKTWSSMKQRCHNPNNDSYKWYGGRGIKVCGGWMDFLTFKKWADENKYQDDLTIDRIDNDKNYCPENCQWITRSENSIKSNHERNLKCQKR